ncbi:MATE family efflux transporter [uncultured Anaerococcus sp.]|uniref:MATE family efflux transporter n=1 Tax=Anaerococcus sp. AH8042_DFU013_CI05 TaxID=3385202 RepID=UPI0025EF8481|nr:MATE family efflux transporter [uncultured Anaerococcus sp.]
MDQNVNLTKGDITKSLIKLSLPLALTAFIQITYGFVDMFFIGRLGSNALAGVGLAGFLIWIANATTMVPKIGMGVLASQAFGRENENETIRILNNGYILTIFLAIIYTVLMLIFGNSYVSFFKLSEIASTDAREYIFVLALGITFFFINPVLSQSFQSLGNSLTPFIINSIGLLANIILDPVLIFGWGPFPQMGVRGAALATVLAQVVVTIIFIIEIFRKNELLRKSLIKIDYRSEWMGQIFRLGLPAALMNVYMAVVSMILNKFMAGFGEPAVAAYSIGSQLESITWNTTEGLQIGIAAMVGQNYGAELFDRVKKIIRKSFEIVFIIGAISMIVLYIFRYPLIRIFVPNDSETIKLGALYLAILSVSQIFMAVEIGLNGAFNGMGDTKTPARIAIILNTLRIPFSKLFMPIFGVAGVWTAMTFTSILKGLFNLGLILKKIKRELN